MVTDLPNNIKIPSNITYIQGTDGVWEPEFESDFDKAVYYAGKSPNPRSKNQKNVIKWIYSLGVSFDEIKDHRKKILEKLKDLTTKDGAWDDYPNVLVPPVFQSFSIEQDEEDELPEGLEELIKEVSEDEEDELPEGLEELLDTVRLTSVVSKKVDINRVLNRKPSETINPNNLKPEDTESENTKEKSDSDDFKKDVNDGINKILGSLITIKSLLDKQRNVEERTAKTERRSEEKREQKELENKLEKKKEEKEKTKKMPEVKPIGGFFDMIKRFFTNILIGGVVLKFFNWINDPNNKSSVERFKNFMVDNAPLILGGLLAIAALPIVPTILSLTGAITGIAIPALKAAFAFLSTPAGLAALLFTLPKIAEVVDPKSFDVETRKVITQSVKGNKTKDQLISKLKEERGKIGFIDKVSKGAFYDRLIKRLESGDLDKLYEDTEKEYEEKGDVAPSNLDKVATISNNILRDIFVGSAKDIGNIFTKGRLEDTPERQRIRSRFSKLNPFSKKNEGQSQKVQPEPEDPYAGADGLQRQLDDLAKAQQPAVQPQTPLMPGLPPSAAQPGTGPVGNQVGSGSVVQYITGDATHPNFEYDGHGTTANYHDHIAFRTKEDKERAKLALRQAGIEIGSENRPWDTDSYHGQGLAIDIPGAQWEGRGAIGETEYTGSRKVRAVLAAAGFSGAGLENIGLSNAQPRPAQFARTPISPPSISSPTGRSGIGILPMPMGGGGSKGSTTGSGAGQTKLPFFSSEDPNNMTMMVVKGIYNVVG